MEKLSELQEAKTKSEVQRIITELDVALSFLREANEISDRQHQQQLIEYAQIAHEVVLGLQPGLALSVPDEIRINTRLFQIRADLKRHGISVPRTLQEMRIGKRKRSKEDRHLN